MLAGELSLAGVDVAVVGDGTPRGLTEALATWFGPPNG
jgi:hypothetical protein